MHQDLHIYKISTAVIIGIPMLAIYAEMFGRDLTVLKDLLESVQHNFLWGGRIEVLAIDTLRIDRRVLLSTWYFEEITQFALDSVSAYRICYCKFCAHQVYMVWMHIYHDFLRA